MFTNSFLDIDNEIRESTQFEWNEFLESFYKIVHVGHHFKETEGVREVDLVRKANYVLGKLKDYWPFLEMDGMMNIWILKPTNSSQGLGIHMCRTLKYVLDVVKANPKRRYIIQKYIGEDISISISISIREPWSTGNAFEVDEGGTGFKSQRRPIISTFNRVLVVVLPLASRPPRKAPLV